MSEPEESLVGLHAHVKFHSCKSMLPVMPPSRLEAEVKGIFCVIIYLDSLADLVPCLRRSYLT